MKNDVLYSEFIVLPDEYIVVDDTDESYFNKFVTNSLDDMIDYLKNTRICDSGYARISIININADNKAPNIKCEISKAKDILSLHARFRSIYLSPKIDEIYSESFELDGPYAMPDYIFDYGILYGDPKYRSYKDGTIVSTTFLSTKRYIINGNRRCLNNTNVTLYRCDLDLDKLVLLNDDISVMYDCFICELTKNNMQDEHPFTVFDGCIPAATMSIIE